MEVPHAVLRVREVSLEETVKVDVLLQLNSLDVFRQGAFKTKTCHLSGPVTGAKAGGEEKTREAVQAVILLCRAIGITDVVL